jgi:dipeptidyl aminopeptidase/acylaminoacyl peptidase
VTAKVPGAGDTELGWQDASLVYDMANDGTQVLFVELSYGEGRNSAIYLRKTDLSPAVRLGFGNRPALSPDRKQVACVRWEGKSSRLMLLPTGAGESKTFEPEGIQHQSVEWFPGGDRILYSGDAPGKPIRSYVRGVAGGEPTAITAEGERAMRISPDGATVVILKDGKYSLRAVDGGAARPLAGIEPGESPLRWTADGRALLLRGKNADRVTLVRLDVSSGRRETLHELKPPVAGAAFLGGLTVSADGRFYAASYQRDLSTLFLMKGLR